MILFPAIDLKEGQCVMLFKGQFEQKTIYGNDPLAMAMRWVNDGAQWIHLVDLDASIGNNLANRQALISIRSQVKVKLQLGGGIRTLDDIKSWFDLGIDRLIVGTIACSEPQIVAEACKLYPGRLAVALDAVDENLMVRGWTEKSDKNLYEMAVFMKELGLSMIIYTDIDRDGAQKGLNVKRTAKVAEISGLPTVASGGVAGITDLKALLSYKSSGVVGAISGKALYEGLLDFKEGQRILKGQP